jgi:hypothetical protein
MSKELEVLDRLLDPLQKNLSEELARAVLTLDFAKSDHARVEKLSYKAQEGKLTPEEEAELDWYLDLNSLLAILKSKARIALRERSPAA